MKAKKFSRKLLALFLAVLMALSCFTGVMTAYAETSAETKYHDEYLDYNSLGWAVLNDEQAATALLDFLDATLAELNMDDFSIPVVNVSIRMKSVDQLLQSITDLYNKLSSFGIQLIIWTCGDAQYIDDALKDVTGIQRNNTSSTDILRAIVKLLRNLSYNGNQNILKKFLRGELGLGVIEAAIKPYPLIGGLLGLSDGYQSNLVYNLVQQLILENTGWFTDQEKTDIRAHHGDDNDTYKLDTILLQKLSTELLQNINVQVTYADRSNSRSRYAEYKENGSALYIDTQNLEYTEDGNVYLFRYQGEKLSLAPTDNLYDFAYKAFNLAWHTVLKDTLDQLNSNPGGFDYDYYMWYTGTANKTWNYSDVKANYADADVKAWAAAMCKDAADKLKDGQTLADQYKSADAFLNYVKEFLSMDRAVVDEPTYTWRDIKANKLFDKLRYSPLADLYFDMETGPLNCSFAQTGTPNLTAFMNNSYKNYTSLVAAFNDFLVAAVADFLPQNAHTGGQCAALGTLNSENPSEIANQLVANALTVIQYIADATDKNILNAFYNNNGTKLAESNVEDALVPLVTAIVSAIDIAEPIHHTDLDGVVNFEGAAALALEEYLSYIMPQKDYSSLLQKDANGKYSNVTLEGTLLPLARDAVGYLMSGYVPLHDKDGNLWDPYTSPVDSSVTLYDLLNSVVVYYAGTDTFNDGEKAKGIGNLLGVCDESGNSLIKLSNSLWANLDAAINELLPVAGTLFNGSKGSVSTQNIIENQLIKGLLDIGASNGVTAIANQMFTIVTAAPIKSTAVIKTVYDLLADLVNGVFGSRTGNAAYANVVPAEATNNHPFYDLLQRDVFAGGTSTSSLGVLGTMIYNLYEATGGYKESITQDTVLPGALYVVQAVNNLAGGFIPQLADNKLKLATSYVLDSNQSVSAGSSTTTTLVVSNNASGLNRAVKDASGEYQPLSRYNIQITSLTAPDGYNVDISGQPIIAGGERQSFTVTFTAPSQPTAVRYAVKYNVLDDKTGEVVYSNLTCFAYHYMTTYNDWVDYIYTRDDADNDDDKTYEYRRLDQSLEGNAGQTKTSSAGDYASTQTTNDTNKLILTYPLQHVSDTSDMGDMIKHYLRIKNTNSNNIGSSKKKVVEYSHAYVDATVYDDATGGNVTVGSGQALACIDPATGDILNYDKIDYSTDGGQTWVKGVTTDDATYTQLIKDGAAVTTRVNHAYTFAELKDKGNVAAYHQGANGSFEYVYLQASGSLSWQNLLSNITVGTGIDGIYFRPTANLTINGNASAYVPFLAYDGKTELKGASQDVKFVFNLGGTEVAMTTNVILRDSGNANAFDSAYDTLKNYTTNFSASDFEDYDGVGTSATYNKAVDALQDATAQKYARLNKNDAYAISDKDEVLVATNESTSIFGAQAYKLVTDATSIPKELSVYTQSKNGVTYYSKDAGGKAVYYSNVALTDADVSGLGSITIGNTTYTTGVNSLGQKVIKNDGTWFMMNDQAKTYKWEATSTTAPYRVEDGARDGYYVQTQFTKVNESGNETSGSKWAVTYISTYLGVPETTASSDARGNQSKAIDNMTYVAELCAAALGDEVAQRIYNEVSKVRENMTAANFDLALYEKMVDAAKDAESKYYACIYRADDPTQETVATCGWNDIDNTINGLLKEDETADMYTYKFTTSSSSAQIDEAIRYFNLYMGQVVDRGYIGDRLEEEIVCASGSAYTAMSTNWTETGEVDDNGEAIKNADVTTTASTVRFGAIENGKIVNKGETVYTEESWQNYINALAIAVERATFGNGDYTHKDAGIYQPADKANYTDQLSAIYDAKSKLVIAENQLEEAPVAAGFDVTGTVIALANTSGKLAGDAFTVIGCDVIINGEVVATTGDDGVFTIPQLAAGTYTATLSYAAGFDRDITITVTDGAVDLGKLGMVVCNFSKDGKIDGTDYNTYKRASGKTSGSATYNAACDFNHDGKVDGTDYNIYKAFSGKVLSAAIYA